jgi:hypothetical protein
MDRSIVIDDQNSMVVLRVHIHNHGSAKQKICRARLQPPEGSDAHRFQGGCPI